MTGPVIQSAVNISEGRRPEVISAVVAVARETDAVVADWSADPDHHRMVVTVLGGPEAVRQAVLAMARVAVARVDLRHHTGAHPRVGAVDVVPVVPIRNVTMAECVDLSRCIGQDLARELDLPVYFYERSAGPGRLSALPDIRKGGFEGLLREPLAGPRAPDLGPALPHPTAGIAIVGTREPLVAYNINLDSPNIAAARHIAAALRRERMERPALLGVRALGLLLASQRRAQVSMNLTRPHRTPLPAIFDFVRKEAARRGVNIYESEIIGLVPRHALGGETPERILWRDYRDTQVLEWWLERE